MIFDGGPTDWQGLFGGDPFGAMRQTPWRTPGINPNAPSPGYPAANPGGVNPVAAQRPDIFARLNQGAAKSGINLQDLGLALLSNSGYSPQKRSFGEIFGQSALQAQQYGRERDANQLREEYARMKLDEYRRAQERETREQDAIGEAMRSAAMKMPGQASANDLEEIPLPKAPSIAEQYGLAAESLARRGYADPALKLAQVSAGLQPKGPDLTDDMREYQLARLQGYEGPFLQYLTEIKKAGVSPGANVTVNTAKDFYGTLAEKQAGQYSELYAAAQSAPEAINRTQRIRDVLSKGAITGTGANQILAIGKGLRAAGFDFGGTDIENTEALAVEMARSTLDAIKSSGLSGSQGLTEGERKFLERAVAGQITLEPSTIKRLADLNERTARLTLKKWNDTSSRLDPVQLRTLGMVPVTAPAPTNETPRSFTTPGGATVEIVE